MQNRLVAKYHLTKAPEIHCEQTSKLSQVPLLQLRGPLGSDRVPRGWGFKMLIEAESSFCTTVQGLCFCIGITVLSRLTG